MEAKEPDEVWDIDLDLRTCAGVPLRLVYSTNVEKENRGIVVDEICAFIGPSKVGYLKIELLPEASLKTFFPSGVLNYMCHFPGEMIFPYGQESTDIKTADLATLQYAVQYFERKGVPGARDLVLENPTDFEPWYHKNVVKTRWIDARLKRYKEFLEFRLGKAFVAYSNTERPNKDFGEPSFIRQGIGTALYLAAALEMERQGMKLRASGMQNDSSKGIWCSFEDRGIVVTDGQHRYLSAPLIRERLGIMLPSASAFSL